MSRGVWPEDFAAWQESVERRLTDLAHAAQLGDSTIESGAVLAHDSDGNVALELGHLDDGSVGVTINGLRVAGAAIGNETLDSSVDITSAAPRDLAAISYTPTGSAGSGLVFGIFDCDVLSTGTDRFIGTLDVDGTTRTPQATFDLRSNRRDTVMQVWSLVQLGGGRQHQLCMKGRLTGPSGSCRLHQTHTRIVLAYFDA